MIEERMTVKADPRLIVSFTSYPARIRFVLQVLESIFAQTLPADLIILWLAAEEFPGREADLPEELVEYAAEEKIVIRWCDDLKPHKKYFYACKEYPKDIIVTIDDDMIYRKDTLKTLYESYLRFPDAVSSMRVHFIPCTEEGEYPEYRLWPKENDVVLMEPSMYLLATGCLGVLYPPGILPPETFDRDGILSTCLRADDLWLKTMELYAGIPVVLATNYGGQPVIKDSQKERLFDYNGKQGGNDLQLERIIRYMLERYGVDPWKQQLESPAVGKNRTGIRTICECAVWQKETGDAKLRTAAKEKKEISGKLKKAENENNRLKQEQSAAIKRAGEERDRARQAERQIRQELENRKKAADRLQSKLDWTERENTRLRERIGYLEGHFLVRLDIGIRKLYWKIRKKFLRKTRVS